MPPDRGDVLIRVLLEPRFSHFFLLRVKRLNYFDAFFLATVMAPENISQISHHVNPPQPVEALHERFHIIGPVTEDGIVFKALWKWSASDLFIFQS